MEIMTVNFSLLALDQIMNYGRHAPPHVGRPVQRADRHSHATGGGKQLAAQHSHSLEGWYAHIPGLTILTPATMEDARHNARSGSSRARPVLIFENQTLYPHGRELPEPRRLSTSPVPPFVVRAATPRSSLMAPALHKFARRAEDSCGGEGVDVEGTRPACASAA